MSADITIRVCDAIPESEFSPKFVQGMYDRMAVSFCKYGLLADAYPSRVNALASLQQRLDKYLETGNTEWLIDVANYAMIEFMHPRDQRAHFRSTGSHESPGRVFEGQESVRRNDEELRRLYRYDGD